MSAATNGEWDPYDLKGSWVAVFLLLIFWWLSLLLHLFHSTSSSSSSPEKMAEAGAPLPAPEEEGRRRSQRISKHFRDGLLFLLTSISIAFVAAAPVGATNALAWIFTAFWFILGVAMFFVKLRRIMTLLAFLDLVLLIALISNAFAHAAVRSNIFATT